MEKKEFQKLFRDYMKARGFRCKGNVCTKFLSDDYLVFAALEHSSYAGEYGVDYGVVYEADKLEKPFNGMMADWSDIFYFPDSDGAEKRRRFDYEAGTAAEFLACMDDNMERRFRRLEDRNYVLDQYRQDWILFRAIPYITVRKICRLAGINPETAIKVRDSRCKNQEMVEEFLKTLR